MSMPSKLLQLERRKKLLKEEIRYLVFQVVKGWAVVETVL
jgi:hypothetical protein